MLKTVPSRDFRLPAREATLLRRLALERADVAAASSRRHEWLVMGDWVNSGYAQRDIEMQGHADSADPG